MLEGLAGAGHAAHVCIYTDPDVLCALPQAAVLRAFPNAELRDDGRAEIIRPGVRGRHPEPSSRGC